MLRPLLVDFDPLMIRRTGERVLGYPPDVFGTTYADFRILHAALVSSGESKGKELNHGYSERR